ncbi:PREDICTED: guanine deaminase [Ceratosolen solmsi marchali]|uniref:Guanine deaminase n=1 Tax=Ceratosolen solmsi marchali TaxID=326594 RepID=A0AAJ6YBD1_9HYME|nr:PREDICTED: guanine deaminase [Ceratosolen solmsi marchali]
MKMSIHSFIGPMIHSTVEGELFAHENVQIDIKSGIIEKVILNPKLDNIDKDNVKILKDGQFLIPGFIDGHIHAVQVPNIGLGYDKPLLDWLQLYIFPLEKEFKDNKFAEKVFDTVVKRTLQAGTTTACYFASLYTEASLVLAKKAAMYGQRALIGKVNMNNSQVTNYFENYENSIKETKAFIEGVRNIYSPLVQPIITPRFALSCDMKLMELLGDLARKNQMYIQTHISENAEEVKAVKAHFTEYSSYAAIYDAAGILTNKTILAHGIHLSDSELAIISKRKSAVIHCPSSNTCLKSGLCNVRRLQAANIKIGLGTDVSGGSSICILDAMRSALQVSIHLSFSKPEYEPLNYKEVFHLATLGGAEALAMNDKIGNFIPGKEFDALVIDLSASGFAFENMQEHSLEQKLQKLIYCGDDRNIVEVYVSGQRVV